MLTRLHVVCEYIIRYIVSKAHLICMSAVTVGDKASCGTNVIQKLPLIRKIEIHNFYPHHKMQLTLVQTVVLFEYYII